MGIQNQDKLNSLQRSLPEGLIVDAAWLERHGYSRALRKKYVTRGWLDQVVPGRHREIHLYGTGKPPGWLSKLHLEDQFVLHNADRLFKSNSRHPRGSKSGTSTRNDLLQSGYTTQPWGQWEWPLTLSSPERAIFELLDEVPQRETFHQADTLMEGLRNLSPRRLHTLLLACRSVKVKRLFLWFAERHEHAWLKKLDRKDVDLGQGKRMLAKGGKLDPKFNITVPESIDAAG